MKPPQDLSGLLREKGLKNTSARAAILGVFLKADCQPINAERIAEKLKRRDINLVTIYRTLSSFESAGILKRVELQKGSAYYELEARHHHHIVCSDCGTIESFEACSVDELTKGVLKRSARFTRIVRHSLEMFGVCHSCAGAGD